MVYCLELWIILRRYGDAMLDLSLIIINYNTKKILLACLESIQNTVRHSSYEIIVVDNGSSDKSVEAVHRAYPSVTVIANKTNEGFAIANNRALGIMRGRYAVLLNSDTVMMEGALDRLLAFMDSCPEAGMSGPQLLNADGTNQTSYGRFPTLAGEFVSRRFLRLMAPRVYQHLFARCGLAQDRPHIVDFIIGACMVVRKDAIDKTGMLDEDFFFFYEEIDWCRRMHDDGWAVYHIPETKIIHLGGGSTKEVSLRARAESWRSRYLYFQKSLDLAPVSSMLVILIGMLQVAYHFIVYTLLGLVTLFTSRRLRRRWGIFSYLFLWHLRCRPISMCLPRR